MRAYRKNSRFIQPEQFGRRLDRNDRARILWTAERMFVRTKQKGRQAGAITLSALQVLRVLLTFVNEKGACYPSYDALQLRTGFARATIAKAIKLLQAVGLLKVARRIERRAVSRVNGWTARPETVVTTVQTSNAYAFTDGPTIPVAPPPPIERGFKKSQLTLTLEHLTEFSPWGGEPKSLIKGLKKQKQQ